ncbi:matrix metalloproteinase-17b isoform X2 [Amphiprion ocellaris]|uniref:matrix metalloproteinase-17b isoform X2 n=1 Tax=Amphiprion ocellaris TaxID=80972 RepID=UPI0016497A41|nr:matrix metalloproteinase-17b isoform X2 [Amphiprion ocellaris]
MKMWAVLLFLSSRWIPAAAGVTPTSSITPVTPTEDDGSRLVDWLMKYGYLPPSDPSTGQLQAWTAVTNAVRAMQKFAGLKDTGVVDEETMALMRSPRCSLPDQEEPSRPEGRKLRRRRMLSMWTRRNINWRLHSYPSSSHLSRETIRSLVFYALRVWAEPTPLEFHEVGSPEAADLQVDFLHGYHGDSYPFDGAGGAVGHAFFPSDPARAGGVHLDAEEGWTFRQPASEGTDLFTVLVHEFGHALGLAHSSSRHSVMRPYYQGPVGDPLHYRLGPQDLVHITQLYGKRNQLLATDAPRLASDPRHRSHHHHRHGTSTDRCNTIFDAVAKIRGETFFFRGLTMWRVSAGGLVSDWGASVRRLWRGLPPDLPRLHAVLERQSDHAIIFISGSVYLFRGDSYWKFMFPGSSPLDGYPRSSAADWLDCTASSSPGVDDFSLSLSPPVGRQELRDGWTEEEEAGGRRKDRHKHVWTQCTCQRAASRSTRMTAALLITWTSFISTLTCSSEPFY